MRTLTPRCLIAVLLSGVSFYSCSSDDNNADDPPAATEEQTKKAAKSFHSLTGISDTITSSNSIGLFQRHVKSAFSKYQAEKRSLSENGAFAGNLCTALNTCAAEGDIEVSTDDIDMKCSFSCRGEDTKPLYSCVFGTAFDKECTATDVTYTIAEGGVVRTGTSCEPVGDESYLLSIDGAYDFRISSSDDHLNDTNFKCSWKLETEFSDATSYTEGFGDGADALIGECENFSCVIDGATVHCDDIKAALEDEDNKCVDASE